MERWVTVAAYVLGVIIVAEVAVLGYGFLNAPVENADNKYQRINITNIEKGQTEDGVVTAEIRAEPYLYCPQTESVSFRILAEFYNDSESVGFGTPDASTYNPFSTSDVGIPRGGRHVTVPANNASLSPDGIDSIRVTVVNRRDQGSPPCREIAFPDEMPPKEFWWNSTSAREETQQNAS